MAIRIQPLQCPQCGANFQVEGDKLPNFCQNCGTRFFIQNDNETTHHNIDEAEVIRAETEKTIQMRKLELLERQQMASLRREESVERRANLLRKARLIKTIAAIVLGLTLFLLGGVGSRAATDIGAFLLVVEVILIIWIRVDSKQLKKIELQQFGTTPTNVKQD